MSLIMDCRCKMHHASCVCRLQLSLLLRMVRPSRGWHTSALHLFLDDDIIGVARFIDAYLERMSTSAGPPVGDQASDQP